MALMVEMAHYASVDVARSAHEAVPVLKPGTGPGSEHGSNQYGSWDHLVPPVAEP